MNDDYLPDNSFNNIVNFRDFTNFLVKKILKPQNKINAILKIKYQP